MELSRLCPLVGILATGMAAAADVGGDPPASAMAGSPAQTAPAHSRQSPDDMATVEVPGHIPDWDRKKYRNLLQAMKVFAASDELAVHFE